MSDHNLTACEQELSEQLDHCQNDKAGWMHRHNLLAQELRVVRAALSFDPTQDRDLETCARRIYHERADFKFAAEGFRKKLDEVVQRNTT